MTSLLRLASGLAVVLLAAGAVLLLAPGWTFDVAIAGGLLASLLVLVEILFSIASLSRRGTSIYDEALLGRRPSRARPPDLEALERSLGWRSYSGPEYDHRVRPILRRVTLAKLRGAEAPGSLRHLLSDEPTSGSVDTAQIERSVAEIERL